MLKTLSNSPDTKRGIMMVKIIVRIYATVMGRTEARAQFKKDIAKQLDALLGFMKEEDWSGLPTSERGAMIANIIQTLRLFTAY